MPRVKCPRCSTIVDYAEGFQPLCSNCGFSAGATPAPVGTRPAGPSQAIAIVALLLNIVVWPGLGSLVGGRIGEGLAQGLLFLLGVFLFFTIILIPVSILLWLGMWIWGIVTGVQLLQRANAQPA